MTICLVMICYNEQDFIVPALQSVENYITHAVILDSNSTDATLGLVDAWHEHNPWIDVSVHQFNEPFRGDTKRTRAIELARGKADYILVMDSDNTLEIVNEAMGKILPTLSQGTELTADAYLIKKKCGDMEYPLLCLFKGHLSWKYTGIIHDFPHLVSGEPYTEALLEGVIIHEPVKGSGPRMKSKRHYYNDALIIEQELFSAKDLTPLIVHRYTFYLAQSYRDAGQVDRAIDCYRARIALGGWYEEVFYSYLSIARLLQGRGGNTLEVMQAALQAYGYRPERLEAAYMLMNIFLSWNMPHAALATGSYCRDMKCEDKLFLEYDTYRHLFPDLLKELENKFADIK